MRKEGKEGKKERRKEGEREREREREHEHQYGTAVENAVCFKHPSL